MVVATLIGLLGQLTLQSQARLDEMPRATFERLTGLHIGPTSAQSDMCMAMSGMAALHKQTHGTSDHGAPHHHDEGACFLCPLLHLPSVVLAALFIVTLTVLAAARTQYVLPLTRAPPYERSTRLPPPRGPPLTA